MENPSAIRLGFGGLPRDGAELTRRLTAALKDWGLEPAYSHARLTGTNIETLTLDFTGTDIRTKALTEPAEGDGREIMHRAPGTVEELSARAAPLRWNGCDIDFDVRARNLPIEWLTYTDGATGIAEVANGPAGSLIGFRARAPIAGIETALAQLGRQIPDLHFSHPRIRARERGKNEFHLAGHVRVRFKFLSAQLGGEIRGRVSERGRVEISRITLRRSNPLLRMMGSKILRDVPRTIDLAEDLPEGMTFHNLRLRITDYLHIEGTVR